MANLSKQKRDKMIEFLEALKEQHKDDDSIRAFNEIENHLREKKYGLVWEEHSEQVDEMIVKNIPVFSEDIERKIECDSELPYNFILEGDNLQSLYLLEKTHKGKIDVIYIDPPYNTTNEGFTYDDKKVDKNDVYCHSKWISFMEKRIKLAKELLSSNGVLFISIDDNEYQNLKMICDEFFGNECFVTSFIWQKKTGASDAKGIATITEYILCYCNNSEKKEWNNIFTQNFDSYDQNRYRNTDEHFEDRGPFYFDNLDRGGLQYSDSMNFGVEAPDGKLVYPNGRSEYENDGWIWKWGKNKIEWGFKNDFLAFQPSSNKAVGWSLKYKNYLNVDNEGNKIERSAPYKNIIQFVINQAGTNDLKALFNNKSPFSNPKPTELIKYLLLLINKKNAIVLDFFAGSGTTGHAVMKLNKEDGGTRKYILATNNENNIAQEVTFTRISKVINGYKTSSKNKELLYEKTFTLTNLRTAPEVIDEINAVIANNRDNFDSISKSFTENKISIYGEHKKDSIVTGIPANLKYFKCDWTPRKPEDYLLSNALCLHIKEMIELQNAIEVDNKKYVLILNKDDFKKTILNDDVRDTIEKIWVNQNIIWNSEELKLLSTKNFVYIPKEFFGQELKEAAE